jgi:uncharacterized damage-inducible protein DinB
MSEKNLRRNLVELLQGGQAHAKIETALEGIEPHKRTIKPQGFEHSIWELLEHMRLAQEDILRYTLDEQWVSPEFPSGYWPVNPEQPQESDWQNSVSRFHADLAEAVKLVEDQSLELTAEIPHGEGRTYLRQILLIADHNAYHMGQLVQLRKVLQDWAR